MPIQRAEHFQVLEAFRIRKYRFVGGDFWFDIWQCGAVRIAGADEVGVLTPVEY